MPSHVFISYAREDRDAALRLRHELIALGVRPWLDIVDLIAGEDWQLAIDTALRDSSHVIVLVSKASIGKRGFVQKEVRVALDLLAEFPPGKIFVIPVRLDDSRPKHEALARLHWVDLFESPGQAVSKIAEALGIDRSSSHDQVATVDASNDTAADSRQDHNLHDVLRLLRGETRFFWPELVELPSDRDHFTAEMQARTFQRVKIYLDYLASRGYLSYRVDHAYDMITTKAPVLNVIVENVTMQLKNLARYIARP